MFEQFQWQVQPSHELPDWFVQAVHQAAPGLSGNFTAQLLWQRGIRNPDNLSGFINPALYQPTSPFEFGAEMAKAVARLHQAWQQAERVAIWGDFDADGITATAVLWDGLGQFFREPDQLSYYIPNRLTESHGLAIAHLDTLAAQGYSLIITCDTGSTNLQEIDYAHRLGIDLIITDHHTLPSHRPPVSAILNPRNLPARHPLAHLSGVAVAYKLVEALYQTLPQVPVCPLEELLDLVAIGLIADLVELTGDCRYLAQQGIQQLQRHQAQTAPRRPGIARLLELCRKSGDRPTDISFGLGPRINAISRIYGDARFCVELLTSQDRDRCYELAEATELANARRKSLQKEVAQQAVAKLADIDLSTTHVIVLFDPQWSVGVLGLVAGQIAQEYNRPTILLTAAEPGLATNDQESPPTEAVQSAEQGVAIARGSARSVNQIDLYELVKAQAALLCSFGGHPFAAGLSLPTDNIPLFTAAINRQMREQHGAIVPASPVIQADLVVKVADLSQALFRELKLLEPYGMGNPSPKLLIQNCWFAASRHANLRDRHGQKVGYIKTEFKLCDDSVEDGFAGLWWGHYKDELPQERCDAIVELDFNTYQKYHVRLLAVRAHADRPEELETAMDWIVDWRNVEAPSCCEEVLHVKRCPSSWDELQGWFQQAVATRSKLAIAYSAPKLQPPIQIWQQLVGVMKYLNRTRQTATRLQLCEKLGIGDRTLQIGLNSLKQLGFQLTLTGEKIAVDQSPDSQPVKPEAIAKFLAAVQEEEFRYQYFCNVPLRTIQATAHHTMRLLLPSSNFS